MMTTSMPALHMTLMRASAADCWRQGRRPLLNLTNQAGHGMDLFYPENIRDIRKGHELIALSEACF
jgi:hypothetical protein